MNDFPSSSDDERMRRMFDDAVADVEPRHSLEAIRRRTSSGSTRRPWLWGAGAAVVATAATITAVAALGGSPGTTTAQDPGFADGSPSVVDTGGGTPTSNGEPTSDASTDAGANTAALPVYYVGDTSRGPRLFREFHAVAGGSNVLADALTQAVSTPPADPDYGTPWPDGTVLNHAEHSGDLLVVDLGAGAADRPGGMAADEASLALEQLIYTAQGVTQSRDRVQFLLDGEPADTVLGVSTVEPLSQGDPLEVLAQVWIIEPAEGAQVPSGFEVTGLANAFEANVQWELMQGDTVVEDGFTTAEECCTMAPYSFTVEAPPGDYTLVVHDSDPSGGEGFAPWQDTKTITVVE